jgi:hypothetical protein
MDEFDLQDQLHSAPDTRHGLKASLPVPRLWHHKLTLLSSKNL